MSPVLATKLYKDKAESDVYAVYAQDEWSFAKDFHTDRWPAADLGFNNSYLGNRSAAQNRLTQRQQSGRFSGTDLERTAPYQRCVMLYSQGYRNATLQQLYMGTVHGSSTPTYGNPDLKPEESHEYRVGGSL
jgi:hemoglobin/transferrin/lactoferrin receptor protein